MSDLPNVIDPSQEPAPKKKRARKTVAERKAELKAKLAELQRKQAEEEMQAAIEAGECYDPEAAKQLQVDMRGLNAGRKKFIAAGLVTQEAFDAKMDELQEQLKAAVQGPQG